MKKIIMMLSISLLILGFSQNSKACSNLLITKGASIDGSTMISYTADSHVLYGELYFRPAADYPAGSMMDVYEWDTGEFLGKIKQVTHTFSVVGNMNEYQVSIGETTYGGLESLWHQPGATMDYGGLIYITLQRAKTAREAIKIMADFVKEYGYCSEGESFSIADPNEVWIMEMIGKGGSIKLTKKSIDNLKKTNVPKELITKLNGIVNKSYPSNAAFNKAVDSLIGKQNLDLYEETITTSAETGTKGAVWVAMRIPDGYISGHANQARITTFPLNDPENCLYAPDVISFAKEKGLYKGEDKNFSFSDTYAPVDFGAARFCESRVWSMFNKVNKDMGKYLNYAMGKNLKNCMPLWIKPDSKISLQQAFGMMRDHFEGTPMDMTQDIGAGPYKCPYRWRPMTWTYNGVGYVHERAISTQQTGFSFVAQSRSWLPNPIGGINWFGVDDSYSTVYSPMYCGITKVPETYAEGNGSMMEYSDNAAFWVFNQVSNFAYTRYSDMIPEIQKLQSDLEGRYIATTQTIDNVAAELYKKDSKLAIQYITDYSVNQGNNTVKAWKELYKYLFTKYMDGNIKTYVPGKLNPTVKQLPYRDEWYKIIVEGTGDKLKVIEEKK